MTETYQGRGSLLVPGQGVHLPPDPLAGMLGRPVEEGADQPAEAEAGGQVQHALLLLRPRLLAPRLRRQRLAHGHQAVLKVGEFALGQEKKR